MDGGRSEKHPPAVSREKSFKVPRMRAIKSDMQHGCVCLVLAFYPSGANCIEVPEGMKLELFASEANSGTLNVSLVTTFALGWLAPRLHRFQAKHPEIEVRMTTAMRQVDFAREDFDCAIRFMVQPDPDLHATRLFNDVLTPLCGKRYKDKLKSLDDLKRVPFIDMTYDPEWSIWLRAVGLGDFKPKRVLTFDSTMIAVEAAMEGAGVAVGPPQFFREELAEGRLYQPFAEIVDSGNAWWFVCAPSSASRPKTRAFEEWLVEELSAPPSRQGRPVVASVRR